MKLALIGKSIQHSKSPELYKAIIGPNVQYDLLDFESSEEIPSLVELAQKYDGLNITSPYKKHFLDQIEVLDKEVLSLGSINTISLRGKYLATNTDVVAAEKILRNYQRQLPSLQVILLGSGSMAQMLRILFKKLGISYSIKSRKNSDDMTWLDLAQNVSEAHSTLVINSCSREFVFKGTLHPEFYFWDLNYHFIPHQNTLPSQVFSYVDGQEMLRFQAEAAAEFWSQNNP